MEFRYREARRQQREANKTFREKNQREAVAMAKNRGDIATAWLKHNKLTPKTRREFNALMKKADKEFKQ